MTGPSTLANLGVIYLWDLAEDNWNTGMDSNLLLVDAVVQLNVLSASTTAPPGSPSAGDRYIVPTGASGVWTSHVGTIAYWNAVTSAWVYFTPKAGFNGFVVDVATKITYNGSAWKLDTQAAAASIGVFYPGTLAGASADILTLALSQPVTVPANLAGTQFLAGTNPAASTPFVVSTHHSGTWTNQGTISVSTAGSLTLPTVSAISLVAGDGIRITGPGTVDTALADFSFSLPVTKA